MDEDVREGLIDLYLSVKIRSNEDIQNCNPDSLEAEKLALRTSQISTITFLNYIQTSLEILMGMKIEEMQRTVLYKSKKKESIAKNTVSKSGRVSPSSDRFFKSGPGSPNKSSITVSMDVVTIYEKQLLDYEKELRNHAQCE